MINVGKLIAIIILKRILNVSGECENRIDRYQLKKIVLCCAVIT